MYPMHIEESTNLKLALIPAQKNKSWFSIDYQKLSQPYNPSDTFYQSS